MGMVCELDPKCTARAGVVPLCHAPERRPSQRPYALRRPRTRNLNFFASPWHTSTVLSVIVSDFGKSCLQIVGELVLPRLLLRLLHACVQRRVRALLVFLVHVVLHTAEDELRMLTILLRKAATLLLQTLVFPPVLVRGCQGLLLQVLRVLLQKHRCLAEGCVLRIPEAVEEMLLRLIDVGIMSGRIQRTLDVEPFMKRPHVMHEAEILGEFEALLDPLRDLPLALILVDANDVCLPVCMRGPVALVLVAAFEGRHSSENTARGTHVTAEEVLATPATVGGIAPRAFRAHPRTEQPCQAQAHVQPMRLYHCERIARCGHPPEIILWQVDEDVLRLVASLAAGRTTF